MSQFVDNLKVSIENLSTKLKSLHPLVKQLEDQTHVPAAYFGIGSGAIVSLAIFGLFGIGLVSNLIGFVYPAYASFKAIESADKADDTQWLTYWVVYALFCIGETFDEYIVYWIPFYYALKIAFLLWCFLPSTHGAMEVYQHVIRPIMKKQEAHVDAIINEITDPKKSD